MSLCFVKKLKWLLKTFNAAFSYWVCTFLNELLECKHDYCTWKKKEGEKTFCFKLGYLTLGTALSNCVLGYLGKEGLFMWLIGPG